MNASVKKLLAELRELQHRREHVHMSKNQRAKEDARIREVVAAIRKTRNAQ